MFLPRRQLIKIGLITAFVLLVGFMVSFGKPVGSTFANHSGSDGLELTIDSYSIYNGVFQPGLSWELKDLVPGVDKFFNFGDITPGDIGLHTISIHVAENPAYVCMDFTNLVDDENGTNEPESIVDGTLEGELSSGMEFFAWRDDGDNEFEVGERPVFGTTSQSAVMVLNDTSYALADAATEEIFEEDETYYVGITWCAGDLTVDFDTAEVTCDAEAMGNEYQTDSFTVDVSLRAVEVSSFANYLCEDPKVDLYLNKQISGVTQGFKLSDFSYHIVGEDTDIIAPHDSFTSLRVGMYTIEELVPDGFVKEDWRIGWYGQCERGSTFITIIEIEDRHLDWGTLYCEADNQYRPQHGDNSDTNGNDEENVTSDDGAPQEQRVTEGSRERQTQRWSQVETSSRVLGAMRLGRSR